jgi:AcrR family transcriptional regulator
MTSATAKTADTAVPRPRGRPRDPRVRRAILDAARGLLADTGVSGFTIEAVAAEARVGKPTIYRRYRSKDDLALAVLVDMVQQASPVPNSGDTHEDFVAFAKRAIETLSTNGMGRVMQRLVPDLATDPDLAAAFRTHVLSARAAEVRQLVEHAIARGDLPADTEPELAHELLMSPIYYRLLLTGAPLDSKLAERVAHTTLTTLAASS